MRCPDTKVKKFTSKTQLEKWMLVSGDFTHTDPAAARNYHHTFRYGFEYSGRINKKDPIFKDRGSPTYPRNENDNLYSFLYQYGRKVENGS
jgi:hypothetical protein